MEDIKQGPAAFYNHENDAPTNPNKAFRKQISFGQKAADVVAKIVGSWAFIVFQSVVLTVWMVANIFLAYQYEANPAYFNAWDPYPFILLNLLLSFEAAYTGPIIMMSQNRQAAKDRLTAELDFEVNKKSEREIKVIMDHLVHQDKLIQEVIKKLKGPQ